ncbi:MAG: 30S ribosomal protein S2, partial [Pseudomonadota bacterium]
IMFVIDANKEELAIKEANTLGIPVVAILDSNVSPDGIAFPVPANDDASRAIRLYCEAIAIAATRGGQDRQAKSGIDLGAQDVAPVEEAVAAPAPAPVAEEAPAADAPVVTAEEFEAPAAAAAAAEPEAPAASTEPETAAEGERQIDA